MADEIHRLRWSAPEIKLVTDAATERLFQKYKLLDMFPSAEAVPKADIYIALKEAQLILPVERRKKSIGTYIADKLIVVVRDSLRSKIQHAKSDAGRPEHKNGEVVNIAPVNDETMQVPPQPEPEPDLLALLGERLGQALARGFVKEVQSMGESPALTALGKVLGLKMPAKQAAAPSGPRLASATVSIERNRRPRVAIIGLLGDQRQAIMRQFPNLDMRFLDNSPSGDRLETVTATCDAAVLMTKFCSHLPMKKFKAKHYVPVNGGMTELATVLRGRYGEPTSARHPAAA